MYVIPKKYKDGSHFVLINGDRSRDVNNSKENDSQGIGCHTKEVDGGWGVRGGWLGVRG